MQQTNKQLGNGNIGTLPTDGYQMLLAQHKAGRKGLDKMVKVGIMPGKMTKQGTIWKFGSWLYLVGMLPLCFIVLWVVAIYTGIADKISFSWNSFKYDNPQAGKFAAIFLSIGAVGVLALMMFGPLMKLGIISFNRKKEPSLDEQEANMQKWFFELPMRTFSGYNTMALIPISIALLLLGIVVSLITPVIGSIIIASVLLVVASWWYWQRVSRPYFGFRHNGAVFANYPNKSWELQLTDCRSVTMAYGDSTYFSVWYDRPFVRGVVKAVGATSLFPFRLIFKLNTGKTKTLVIYNAKFNNNEHINAQEVEILVAQKLNSLGFHIQLHYQDNNIAGWTATPNDKL